MPILTQIRQMLFDLKYEPFAVTGGLYLFTALYYTRQPAIQLISFVVMILVTAYWVHAIRNVNVMHLRDFRLTTVKLWLQVGLAIGLAVFGWFYYRFYIQWTRGFQIELGYGGSLGVIFAAISVAIAEEIFFRGYLQNRLRSHHTLWRRVLIAVFALAFYKTVVHMWEGMPFVFQIELLLLGVLHNVLPSLWMEWSDSLVGPLLLHVFWDLLVYAPMGTIPPWVF
jgi:membrane protease YdiL (CAAX protease family)